MSRSLCLAFVGSVLLGSTAWGQGARFLPGTKYNADVPTLRQVVGHGWAEAISSTADIERYIRALADHSPQVQLVEYGRSWEGRGLHYLVIGTQANVARIEEIKEIRRKLREPRTTSREEAETLIESLPAVTWLAYGVHGDEISSSDAGLFMAYHLIAAEENELAGKILDETLVIIDPTQNPDGRDRFVNFYRRTRGRWADASPDSSEHHQPWPGGRVNHYLFDLNRDWFAHTQIETQAKVRAFKDWHPEIYVDLHEMGGNSTYFFPPWADPVNPNLTEHQGHWIDTIGRNNAKWFDRMRFDYFTGEVFDEFYPGYGASWPLFQGAMGMTYEQASSRGLVYRREDETVLHYRDGVQHHFIASLSTAEAAAEHRREMLLHAYEHRATAIEESRKETVKEYILPPGRDPNRTAELAGLLMAQGIEVRRADRAFTNKKTRDYYGGEARTREFPAGTFLVLLAQPDKRLAKTLLDPHTPMDEPFIKEQLRRHEKRMPDQIYDTTSWSLPLLYGVEAFMAEEASPGRFGALRSPPVAKGALHGGAARLAYLIPWGTHSAARALAELQRNDIRVHTTDKAFTMDGQRYGPGSLIIKTKDNPRDLHQRMTRLAKTSGVDIQSTHTAWVSDGVNFGSGKVRFIQRPKVALAYDRPTRPNAAGATRFILERQFGYPVTVVNTGNLGRADLSKFNVLILPSGRGYSGVLGEGGIKRIKDWINHGGTLITLGQATVWLTEEDVDLLATERERRGRPGADDENDKGDEGDKNDKKNKPQTVEEAIRPEKEWPSSTPGAFMRVKLDTEHWLASGYEGHINVLVNSRNILKLVKLDQGRNVGHYESADKLVVSGFTWDDVKELLPNKAFLVHRAVGRGHVVAFTEDPSFRAYLRGLNLLFLNAVFFGPAH